LNSPSFFSVADILAIRILLVDLAMRDLDILDNCLRNIYHRYRHRNVDEKHKLVENVDDVLQKKQKKKQTSVPSILRQ
jgi:hypothetical protein